MLNNTNWRQHVALDVGTASIRIASGISSLIEKPSCIGDKRALHGGVVVDSEVVSHILQPLLDRARIFGIVKPCVLTCAPSDARQEERQSLIDAIKSAGVASVKIIPEPLAAAIGAGVDVSSPYAQMVIDIGEGVTDCAIMRSSKIHATCALRVGCDRMRHSILMAAQRYGYEDINYDYADMLLQTRGLVRSSDHPGSVLAATALVPVMGEIGDAVDSFLQDLPHDLVCEIIHNGICLTGGGALIPGVLEYIEQRTGINVTLAPNPRSNVVEGARAILPIVMLLNAWE